jgi:predicted metal-dependent hydrolase
MPATPARVATHQIIQADALAWMAEHPAPACTSVITSLPDVSELSQLDFDAWRSWFIAAARSVMRWLPPEGVAIFYQSDIRHGGVWVDKSYLVMCAAEQEQAALAWHKIVCRRPPGTIALGRPSYSHMLCFARNATNVSLRSGPDVLSDAGAMSWSRAMGDAAGKLACRYLQTETPTRTVVDPFCGQGSVLAIASAMGFDVIGVDLSAKRCRLARNLIARTLPVTDAFTRGAALFDAGAFFDAHEAWEERWRVTTDPTEKLFLQGLIQVAAGFHKLFVVESVDSALRLLAKGLAKLDACPAQFAGMDLANFRRAIAECARAISVGTFERMSIPRAGCSPVA